MDDNVLSCIGTYFIRSILKYAKYSFIDDQIRLGSYKCEDSSPSAVIILNQTYNEQFFKKLLKEISRRNEKVFVHIQNRHQGFRNAFIEYLRNHLTEFCVEYFKIPLVLSSKLGYEDFVSFIVEKWKEQSRPELFYERESSLYEAFSMGHSNIVKILVDL
ncbi:PPP2R3 [Mytilus edulis]|uniref:PPP2R3 n=1 Tax=Mytilus edulis TaxID=6550 RepID=A0A8S3R5P3_MYTED|nr:PPP2R3 [Mytilus edulis]